MCYEIQGNERERRNMKAIGLFLIGEGILSMIYSKDKRPICQVGRLTRIIIGWYILLKEG